MRDVGLGSRGEASQRVADRARVRLATHRRRLGSPPRCCRGGSRRTAAAGQSRRSSMHWCRRSAPTSAEPLSSRAKRSASGTLPGGASRVRVRDAALCIGSSAGSPSRTNNRPALTGDLTADRDLRPRDLLPRLSRIRPGRGRRTSRRRGPGGVTARAAHDDRWRQLGRRLPPGALGRGRAGRRAARPDGLQRAADRPDGVRASRHAARRRRVAERRHL